MVNMFSLYDWRVFDIGRKPGVQHKTRLDAEAAWPGGPEFTRPVAPAGQSVLQWASDRAIALRLRVRGSSDCAKNSPGTCG
jgi:hypothetical protein